MILFTSLFGVDLDFDLLPFWIEHYKKYQFDEYEIYLHSGKNDKDRLLDASLMLHSAGFFAHAVDPVSYRRPDDCIDASTTLRNIVLDAHVKKCRPIFGDDSYLVVADSDEFQRMPDTYRSVIGDYDYVFGELIDRYDTTLHNADPDIELSVQFPFAGDVHDIIRKEHCRDARWFYLHKTKILAAKLSVPVNYVGSHNLFGELAGNTRADLYSVLDEMNGEKPILIDHYTWRETIIDRMCYRPYYTSEQIYHTARFFGIDHIDTPSFREKIAHEDSIQEDKGWIPCRSRT